MENLQYLGSQHVPENKKVPTEGTHTLGKKCSREKIKLPPSPYNIVLLPLAVD